MKKVRKYEKKSFESTGQSWDTSSNIYESMMASKKWKELSSSQKVLYLTCKAQYYDQKSKPNNIQTQFYMNQSLWLHKYELYSASNLNGFYRDMKVLISSGFVDCLENGKNTRTKSVYELSARWSK